MVKRQSTAKRPGRQGASRKSEGARPVRITAETPYGECSERLTAFGGLLALVKFLDLLGFEAAFAQHYVSPQRTPKLGDYRMVLGILVLLFIVMGDVVSHVDLFAAPVILEIASLAAGVRGQSRRDQSYRTSELQSLRTAGDRA